MSTPTDNRIFTFYTPDGASVGTITCATGSQAYQQLIAAGYSDGRPNQVDTPGHFYAIESKSDNADQAHPLSAFPYVAIFAAHFSSDHVPMLARVGLVAQPPITVEQAANEAHSYRYDINQQGLALTVATVYHNRYGNGRVPTSAQAELEKAQLHDLPIRDFGSVHEMTDWLKEQDEGVNGHINDAIADAKEWRDSNPEWAHHDQWVRRRNDALARGEDFDPDSY